MFGGRRKYGLGLLMLVPLLLALAALLRVLGYEPPREASPVADAVA